MLPPATSSAQVTDGWHALCLCKSRREVTAVRTECGFAYGTDRNFQESYRRNKQQTLIPILSSLTLTTTCRRALLPAVVVAF